jgi:hypothetical protein
MRVYLIETVDDGSILVATAVGDPEAYDAFLLDAEAIFGDLTIE